MAQKKACHTNVFSLPFHTPHCHLSWRLCSPFCLGSSPSDQQPCINTGLPAFVPVSIQPSLPPPRLSPQHRPLPAPSFPSWPSSGDIEPFSPGQRCLLCSDPLLSCPTCSSVSGTLRGNQQECIVPGLSLFGKEGVTAAQLLLSPACTLCKPVPCCHSPLMRPTDQLPSSTTQWKCPSFIFSTRNYSHWGTEALSAAELQAGLPAGFTSGSRPACALRVQLRTVLRGGPSVHRLTVSWTSTAAIYAMTAGMAF